MVYAASMAPSGGNVQPWHFSAITSPLHRDTMARIVHDEGTALSRRVLDEIVPHFLLSSLVFSTAPLVFAVSMTPFPLEEDACFSHFQKEHNLQGRDIDRYGGFVNVQSVAAAIENLLLAAHELGYGSCWLRVPYYAKDKLEEFLAIRKPWELIALVPVGIPDQKPRMPPRKPVDEILTFVD